MAEIHSLRRVLIVADESADWMVAGLRQLERLALSIDEFALENKETAPVQVCIFWRPDLDQSQRWTPNHERITRVAFTTELEGESFDLVLGTRLFLYRKAIRPLLETPLLPPPETLSSDDQANAWKICQRLVESLPHFREGAWDYIANGEEIDEVEARFLRRSGKSQDGLVSRYLNRPISRVVTRLLLRFPTTPNGWTLSIVALPIMGSLILLNGSYWSFVWGLILYQVYSILDGCDGEIARAKFLESERGRQLDGQCDILGNILLVLGLGAGLSRQMAFTGRSGWFYLLEGFLAAALIGLNEFWLARSKSGPGQQSSGSLGDTLYPRHRELVARSGLLVFGETFVSWLIQLTKRDVAILFFVFLAAIGLPAFILHLLVLVTAFTLAFAFRARHVL
ncbi:MAG TPA: CDP-alcohol phosphatidyltransferase family protein [Chthoniobacterales bacterium]|nr:CDP-alcohol phosphatidyltransferase family protein [Chthoniobacterales bacterium]